MFNPGDKVKIDCPSFGAPGHLGQVHIKNFTDGLISVKLEKPLQGIYDFAPEFLEKIND